MSDEDLTISRSVVIDAPVDTLYDMVADLPRMGEWSRACTGATWDDGAGPTEGSWFTGHNVIKTDGETRVYDTRCEITAAERPSTIAWMQRGRKEGVTEWRYSFAPIDGGTEVTESWSLVRPFPESMENRDEMLERMQKGFSKGIEDTLAGLKAAAEG
jgi:uncharacterized protein YndB with AHSA1/START domain